MKKSEKPTKKDGLISKKPVSTLKFKNNDLAYLAILLKKGYSFSNALSLLEFENKITSNIDLSNPQQVIINGSNKKTRELLTFFIKVTSLEQAINASLAIIDFKKRIRNKIINKCTYPIFIMIFAFFTVFLFADFIIPQLLNGFGNTDSFLYLIILFIKKIVIALSITLFSILVFSITYFKSYRFKVMVLPFLCKFFKVICDLNTYYLAGYLNELYIQGLNTKDSMKFLNELNNNSSVYYIASIINKKLMDGVSLENVIAQNNLISKKFKKIFIVGNSTNMFDESLKDYLTISEETFFKYIKVLSTSIQLIAYSFVGILLVCVYQIMLIPLNMLETM